MLRNSGYRGSFRRSHLGTRCASSEPAGSSLRQPDEDRRMLTSLLATLSIPSQRVRLQRAVQNHPWTSRWDTLRRSTRTSIPEGLSEEPAPDAATQKHWYGTEALVREHGRMMGCPRCKGPDLAHTASSAGDGSKESCCS